MAGLAGATNRDTEVRLPRATAVKNKQPADRQVSLLQAGSDRSLCTRVQRVFPHPAGVPDLISGVQITAEQILRESRELQEQTFKPPTQKITDITELNEYRLRKRKEFEDLVRRVRWNSSVWVKVSILRLVSQTNPHCMMLNTSKVPSRGRCS